VRRYESLRLAGLLLSEGSAHRPSRAQPSFSGAPIAADRLPLLDRRYVADGQLATPARQPRPASCVALANYFARCSGSCPTTLLSAARSVRYDIELLRPPLPRQLLAGSCHRKTTLQDPGRSARPFHFVRLIIKSCADAVLRWPS